MNKKIIFVFSLLFFLFPFFVFAQSDYGLGDAANAATLTSTVDLPSFAAKVIGAALSMVGVIFLVLFIWGGFIWMTAGGKADSTKKAKDLMINAVIGLVLIFSAYFITKFVVSELTSTTTIQTGT